MSKIVIFKEVEEKALDNNLEGLVLFGESNLLEDTKNVYDLIFHAKQTDPYQIITPKKPCSLVIPVIRAYNKDQAISEIYYKYTEHPDFTKFVATIPDNDLSFYEVNPQELGKKIISFGKYKRVEEKKFLAHTRNLALIREINEKRRLINRKY